ncbi:MAG: hypothetical protein V3R80_09920 [Candidatus Tectomicrobia bacterium]
MEEKTFKVLCSYCQKPFHIRFPFTRPDATGEGEVVVTCLYCGQNVIVTIPQVYIEEESLLRSRQSRPTENS